MMYGIEISYSWGEMEDWSHYGTYESEEEAYKKACRLAGMEAYVQNEEMWPESTCSVYFDGFNKIIDLHYHSDDQHCYYKILDTYSCEENLRKWREQ